MRAVFYPEMDKIFNRMLIVAEAVLAEKKTNQIWNEVQLFYEKLHM